MSTQLNWDIYIFDRVRERDADLFDEDKALLDDEALFDYRDDRHLTFSSDLRRH